MFTKMWMGCGRFEGQCLPHDPDGLPCARIRPAGQLYSFMGRGIFTPRTHGIAIANDMVYTVDDGDHTVRKFTLEGKQVMMIGAPGKCSDTGYDGKTVASIKKGGQPFNRPTDVAVAPDGELYVCDGYGNARVHRFKADGTLIQSWASRGRPQRVSPAARDRCGSRWPCLRNGSGK